MDAGFLYKVQSTKSIYVVEPRNDLADIWENWENMADVWEFHLNCTFGHMGKNGEPIYYLGHMGNGNLMDLDLWKNNGGHMGISLELHFRTYGEIWQTYGKIWRTYGKIWRTYGKKWRTFLLPRTGI
jgi:hypothetical protein